MTGKTTVISTFLDMSLLLWNMVLSFTILGLLDHIAACRMSIHIYISRIVDHFVGKLGCWTWRVQCTLWCWYPVKNQLSSVFCDLRGNRNDTCVGQCVPWVIFIVWFSRNLLFSNLFFWERTRKCLANHSDGDPVASLTQSRWSQGLSLIGSEVLNCYEFLLPW